MFPHILNGHGLLMRDYIRDYTTRGTPMSTVNDPYVHNTRSLSKPDIDSSHMGLRHPPQLQLSC